MKEKGDLRAARPVKGDKEKKEEKEKEKKGNSIRENGKSYGGMSQHHMTALFQTFSPIYIGI